MNADKSIGRILRDKEISLPDKIVLAAASVLGLGYAPLMPGTVACLAAVFVFLIVKNQAAFFVLTAIFLMISFPLSTRAEKILGEKDCKKIVIDDFAGMMVSYLFISRDVRFMICGFFLFRMLDMIKIPPADSIEKLSGGKGIVGDDLVAGIYANLIIHIVMLLPYR